MTKYAAYLFGVLLLISSICSGVNDKNSKIKITDTEFNFKNLYTKHQYSVMDYGVYDPGKAMGYCNKSIPSDAIWPTPAFGEEPLPNFEPTAGDCGNTTAAGDFNMQMAYGCTVDLSKPGSIGAKIARSVVKLYIPYPSYIKPTICSAIVVDQQWLLTSGHCVAYQNSAHLGRFFPDLEVFDITVSGLQNSKTLTVDEIIIPKDYNFYQSRQQRPYPGYINEDFALLHLNEPLGANYTPISLAREPFKNDGPISVWTAGFGQDEGQNYSGELHFRKQYFMTNIYGGWSFGTASGNYHEIYTTGSIPLIYKGILSSWSFNGPGDSGGPIFLEDSLNHKFLLEGIHGGGVFCNYPGYFAKLPYSYDKNVSIPDYRELIISIINGTLEPEKVRCIAPNNYACSFRNNMYVINMKSNSITSYKVQANGDLEQLSSAKTGERPSQVATIDFGGDKKYAFVTNYFADSVSRYQVGLNGQLIKIGLDYKIPSHLSALGPIDIKILGSYAYIVEGLSEILSVYSINSDGILNKVNVMDTGDRPGRMEAIVTNGRVYGLIPDSGSQSISVYLIDISNGSKSTYIKDVQIKPEYGYPIEIAVIPGQNSVFYLLTTKKILIINLSISNSGKLSLDYWAEKSGAFNANSRIKALLPDKIGEMASIWISTGTGNSVNRYMVDNLTKISDPATMIFTDDPTGIETMGNNLYVTNFNLNALTRFSNPTQPNPHPQYIPAENGPNMIQRVSWKIPAD